ncbi:PSBP DOMAIN-CONTAINING PROTEIN 5 CHLOROPLASTIC [Salix viminalis]|uniref:PSBP DOMAIN-CONTAINING PROTEIN 5 CHLOROPLASTIC n=2 Tax=Salix TaxID=40685 RepID=A0A6N2LFD8_SALVM|nr:hypothetical protein OIU84_009939 [Salix udensis]KAJ6743623.1 PSBP DOMAIN-CONTAINING PROTEIN 5 CHLOROPLASTIC [Salix viminalis]
MAMALLCSPSPFTTHHINPFFRNQSRILLSQKKCKLKEKIMACSCACSSSDPSLQNRFCRRDLMLFGLSSSLSIAFPSSGILAGEDLKMASVVDEINAYTYSYPVELPSKKFLFKWVESRKPERYSSAAPLSPDARLRIVSERVDIIDNLILSVSIGPPNLQFVKSKDKSTWAAKDVADSVLSDKSSLRVTSTQRLSESSILDARANKIDGEPYWFYEYIVRKSPTKTAQESNLFRHYIASTTERDGYLYSLSASTLSKQWDKMGPYLEKTVASFRLLPPTKDYVPPFKDPWRFW